MSLAPSATKAVASFLLLVALLALVAGLGVYSVSQLRASTAKVIHDEVAIGFAANAIQYSSTRVRQKEKSLFISLGRPFDPARDDDPQQELVGFNQYVALLLKDIEALSKLPLPAESAKFVASMPAETRRYQQAVNDIYKSYQSGSITTPRQADDALRPFKSLIRDNRAGVVQIIKSANENLASAIVAVEASALRIERTIIGFSMLAVVVGVIAALVTARQLRDSESAIRTLNQNLEQRVEERTHALEQSNEELSQTLEYLKNAKDGLVRSEKLAALGSMVAGVAHELNTPIGNARLAASTLSDAQRDFAKQVEAGVTRAGLQSFVERVALGSGIIERSLVVAGELVSSFKRVAVDQSSFQRRVFKLDEAVHEILVTMGPTVRRTGVQVVQEIPHGIVVDGFPGPLGQVLMNLINNALIHGLSQQENGVLKVSAYLLSSGQVCMSVSDDGHGIAPEHMSRIFDPFFTTQLGRGGSGLGLSIVHNLLQDLLGGTIQVQSTLGVGTTFTLTLPLVAPHAHPNIA